MNEEHQTAQQMAVDAERLQYIASLEGEAAKKRFLLVEDIIDKLTDAEVPFYLAVSPLLGQGWWIHHQFGFVGERLSAENLEVEKPIAWSAHCKILQHIADVWGLTMPVCGPEGQPIAFVRSTRLPPLNPPPAE